MAGKNLLLTLSFARWSSSLSSSLFSSSAIFRLASCTRNNELLRECNGLSRWQMIRSSIATADIFTYFASGDKIAPTQSPTFSIKKTLIRGDTKGVFSPWPLDRPSVIPAFAICCLTDFVEEIPMAINLRSVSKVHHRYNLRRTSWTRHEPRNSTKHSDAAFSYRLQARKEYLDSLGIGIFPDELTLAVFAFLGKPVLEPIPLGHLRRDRPSDRSGHGQRRHGSSAEYGAGAGDRKSRTASRYRATCVCYDAQVDSSDAVRTSYVDSKSAQVHQFVVYFGLP